MNKSLPPGELLEEIRSEIQEVILEILDIIFSNMQRRVQLCFVAQGGHFRQFL